MSAEQVWGDLPGWGGADSLAGVREAGVEITEAFCNKLGAPGGRVGVAERFPFFNARHAASLLEAESESKPEREKRDTNAARKRRRGRPHGRPTALSPEVCQQLYLLLSVGLSRRRAARRLGLDPASITYRAKRDESFRRAVEAAIVRGAEETARAAG